MKPVVGMLFMWRKMKHVNELPRYLFELFFHDPKTVLFPQKLPTIRIQFAVQQRTWLPYRVARKNYHPECWWWWRIRNDRRKTSADVLFSDSTLVVFRTLFHFRFFFPLNFGSLNEDTFCNELEHGIELWLIAIKFYS